MKNATEFLTTHKIKPRLPSDEGYLRRWALYCDTQHVAPMRALSPEGVEAFKAWAQKKYHMKDSSATDLARRIRLIVGRAVGVVYPVFRPGFVRLSRCICGEQSKRAGCLMCAGCLASFTATRRAPKGSPLAVLRKVMAEEIGAATLAAHVRVSVLEIWRRYVGQVEVTPEWSDACMSALRAERARRGTQDVAPMLSAYSGRGFTYPEAGGF